MKLRIIQTIQPFIPSEEPLGQSGIYLNVPLEQQQKSNWCWASIGVALLRHFHGIALTQRQLSSWVLKEEEPANKCVAAIDVFSLTGTFDSWTPGKPSLAQIASSITNQCPVCVRLEWHRGGAHYVLIDGFDLDGATIEVNDPQYGRHSCLYGDFPESYSMGPAMWSETYWTTGKSTKYPNQNNLNKSLKQ